MEKNKRKPGSVQDLVAVRLVIKYWFFIPPIETPINHEPLLKCESIIIGIGGCFISNFSIIGFIVFTHTLCTV